MSMGLRLMWLFSLSAVVGCTASTPPTHDVGNTWDVALPPRVTAAPDGIGYCCLPDTPSCDCHFLGAHADTASACEAERLAHSICDLHPDDWTPSTDVHGCNLYFGPPVHVPGRSCFPDANIGGDAGADAP